MTMHIKYAIIHYVTQRVCFTLQQLDNFQALQGIASNARRICAKVGRLDGSFSKQDRINADSEGGHQSGIDGRRSRLRTARAHWIALMPSYGHSPLSVSHMIIPNEKTSAGSAYGWFAKTSGAIHWTVPQLPVMLRSCALIRDRPKSQTLAV
jgi:hypothetical protein